MTTIYTIGFTKKTLQEFLDLLKENKITKLVDIRINRVSQLAGFAKEEDLKYLLNHFMNIKYEVIEDLAPTKEILKEYRDDKDWEKYEETFLRIMKERNIEKYKNRLFNPADKVVLLCSEAEPEKCHRRLVAEYYAKTDSSIKIIHLE